MPMKQYSKNHTIWIGLLIVLLLGGFLSINQKAATTPQEIRQKAVTPQGVASVQLTPSSTSFTSGQSVTLTLSANIPPNYQVDGFQLEVAFSGAVPLISFKKNALVGITPVTAEMTNGGTRFRLAYITTNPQTPYATSGLTVLGAFTFTAPRGGSLTATYNTTLTKIVQNQSTEDIVGPPTNMTYTFIQPTPTPTPVLNYCGGINGSSCTYVYCSGTPCTGRLCPKTPCRVIDGLCQNHICRPR